MTAGALHCLPFRIGYTYTGLRQAISSSFPPPLTGVGQYAPLRFPLLITLQISCGTAVIALLASPPSSPLPHLAP
jgi:hypothetical protein